MARILLLLILLFVSGIVFSGDGAWERKVNLLDIDLMEVYGVNEQNRISGQDAKEIYKQRGFVYLDYTRKDFSDLSFSNEWKVQVHYHLDGDAGNTKILEISKLGVGGSVYLDYQEEIIAAGDAGFEIVITKVEGDYKLGSNPWVHVANAATSQYIPDDIDVRLELRCETMYELDPQTSPEEELSRLFFDTTNFQARWSYVEGAEEYDLEWVFIDKFSNEYNDLALLYASGTSSQADIGKAFELKEPARVRVWGTSFNLDNVYTEGTLYFRVRSVSTFSDGAGNSTDDIKLGPWSYLIGDSPVWPTALNNMVRHEITSVLEFEATKNWLYGVAFAEHGKNVSSVSFYDGSNRARQSIAYSSSDNISLVSESKYDREGRQTLSILPAPVAGRSLGYRANFNLAVGGLSTIAFDEEDFDFDNPNNPTNLSETVEPLQVPSSTIEGGAAQYFSDQNTFTDDLYRAAIPDADGYVYSQTVYRNDGSGRVKEAGGIGAEFQINGGHGSKIFYGSPTETELKRLFGNNISDDPSGYRKEMVSDANGQYSVTYYDKRGNVIATGLSGDSPGTLLELDDAIVSTITTDLNTNNVLSGYTLNSENTLLNGIAGNVVSFHYELDGLISQFNGQVLTNQGQTLSVDPFCSTCRYDLTITVLDGDGNPLPSTPYTQNIDPTVPCSIGSNAAAAGGDFNFQVTLPEIGEYRIIKELVVDQASMQADFDLTLVSLGLDDPTAFITDYVSGVDISGCFTNCDDYCIYQVKRDKMISDQTINDTAAVTTWWNSLSASAQTNLIDDCLATACDPDELYQDFDLDDGTSPPINPLDDFCVGARDKMIKQISPGGVFYDNSGSEFWDQLETLLDDPSDVIDLGGNNYTLAQLQDPSTFPTVEAESLLVYHREACHLEYCDDWAETMGYSTSQSTIIYGTGGVNSGATWLTDPIYTTIQNSDPFTTMDFNGYPSNNYLNDLMTSYVVDNPFTASFPCFSTAPSSGDLVTYVDFVVNCIVSTEPANTFSTDEIDQLRKTLFIGLYNNIKEELIADYKSSDGCAYIVGMDYHRVFIGPMDTDDISSFANQSMSGFLNGQTCQTTAIVNAHNWIDQLPPNCLTSLENENPSEYTPGYDNQDLISGLYPGEIQQLMYDYTISMCGTNAYGWFYDPDVLPSVVESGELEYDSIKAMLSSSCGLTSFSFELTPPPSNVTVAMTNQIFPPCFWHYLDMINDGLATLQTQTPVTTGLPANTIEESGYALPVNSSSYPLLYDCSNNAFAATYTFDQREKNDGTDHWFENDLGTQVLNTGCRLQLNYTFDFHEQTGYLTSLNNPVKHSTYTPANGTTPLNNIVTFDAAYSDGSIRTVYIEMDFMTCLDAGDFNDLVINEPPSVTTVDYTTDCINYIYGQAAVTAQEIYNNLIGQLQDQFLASLSECLPPALENFSATYQLKEYQYTLYYYDLAGNLVQTVPPQGVDILTSAEVANGDDPDHTMQTRYQYNGLNTLIATYTPDGGRSDFYLDKLYRVRYSQNARQVVDATFSYTRYDALGRVIEAGEAVHIDEIVASVDLPTKVEDNTYPLYTNILDYTKTYYEEGVSDPGIASAFGSSGQENLRNAIGAIVHRQLEWDGLGTQGIDIETVTKISYSYDAHGNVKRMVSSNGQLKGIGREHKIVDYEYDLVSGNMNELIYQEGQIDEIRHRYHYDANNRLVRAFNSRDDIHWEMDAKYFYFLHGSLARVETGHDKVQGTDFAYNLQGWLKGVNSGTLDETRDLGTDGHTAGINQHGGMDAFGYQLGYFDGDYKAISETGNSLTDRPFASTSGLITHNLNPSNFTNMGNLYNGNITNMVTAIRKDDGNKLQILGNNYQYDQLQRIRDMKVYSASNLEANNSFNGSSQHNGAAYASTYSFDKNGNLKTLTRNGSGVGTNLAKDDFTYNYYADLASSSSVTNPTLTNRLSSVQDIASTDGNYTDDIKSGQTGINYQYDKSGQLTEDVQEGIKKIGWTTTGKVKYILFTNAAHADGKRDVRFIYDPMDMRVAKVSAVTNNEKHLKYTYYSYDASGNVLATYERIIDDELAGPNQYSDKLYLKEHMLYGSSRLGTERRDEEMVDAVLSENDEFINLNLFSGFSDFTWTTVNDTSVFDHSFREVNDKSFELSNHLGNVLAVITDMKIQHGSSGSQYAANVIQYSDYYPYGSLLDGRHGGSDYSYGFQGQEMDDEIRGKGNSVNYKYRMHDPRVGRFFAVDPLSAEYPHNSPYAFSENKVIAWVELEGLEASGGGQGSTGTPTFNVPLASKWEYNGSGYPQPFTWGGNALVASYNGVAGFWNLLGENDAKYGGIEAFAQTGKDLANGLDETGSIIRDYIAAPYMLSEITVDDTENIAAALIGPLKGAKKIFKVKPKLSVKAAKSIKSFTHAETFGLQGYKKLKANIKSTGLKLEAHHLLESRFATTLGLNSYQMTSIALTKAEHQVFTNAWRKQIPYNNSNAAITTSTASKSDIFKAAKEIYKDYPDILERLDLND